MIASEHCHCCPNPGRNDSPYGGLSRRLFLAGMTAGGALLANINWPQLSAAETSGESRFSLLPEPRRPLIVQPVLVYNIPVRQEMVSWRGWGGIDSPESAEAERVKIAAELESIRTNADFPVEFLPVAAVNDIMQMKDSDGIKKCDLILLYGAGDAVNGVQHFGKDVIIFQRWKSGPVYLQYEIVSPRLLRQHTDSLKLANIRFDDVVTDSLDELTWRLRALCGLKNTRNSRILAVGGPDAWAQSAETKEKLYQTLREKWSLDIQTVDYAQIDELLAAAAKDEELLKWAQAKADEYLALPETVLSTERERVVNCFVLDHLFRLLMRQAGCKALTVFGCMVTIIPKAKTTACLTLSTLNDDGYLTFCESDFAVIPSGMLLANITGHPVFLNDPTYPHDGIVTLAHCTAPRKMDAVNREPAEIVTHFESDFGAAPKVNMKIGETVTCIMPDFLSQRWGGFTGTIVDNPFKPICRTQLDIAYKIPDLKIAENMPGFHWMMAYGDYRREIGYALRRTGIIWDDLEKEC